MQDNEQFKQLILQYTQLKNGAIDIKEMLKSENYDGIIRLMKYREALFLSCKNIRSYLELTKEQENELNCIIEEIKNLEFENISMLAESMEKVKKEIKQIQKNEKIQQAYDFNEGQKGSIINYKE